MKEPIDFDINRMAQFGIAAMLPGMQHMLDQMQAVVDRYRELLGQVQMAGPKRGRPAKRETAVVSSHSEGQKAWWNSLTPEARTAENERRATKRAKTMRKNAAAAFAAAGASAGAVIRQVRGTDAGISATGLTLRGTPKKRHPRDPAHPDHAAWVVRMAAGKAAAQAARNGHQQAAQ